MDFVYPRSVVFAGNTEFWTVLPSCRIQAYNSVKLNNSKVHGVWFSSQDSAVFLISKMAQIDIPSGNSESRYHVSVEIREKISWITISQEEEIWNLS